MPRVQCCEMFGVCVMFAGVCRCGIMDGGGGDNNEWACHRIWFWVHVVGGAKFFGDKYSQSYFILNL